MTFVHTEHVPGIVRFHPGNVVMTPGAAEAMKRAGQKPGEFIARHVMLEQGDLCENDWKENRSAMKSGLRIFGSFNTSLGNPLWIITEWVDMKAKGADVKKRELTTILLPDEY